jgi:peptide subunit release factor 1 (eRF1)
MATDPTQQIVTQRHDSALVTRARGALAKLAALPPSTDVPYLTVSLDCRPAGEDPARETEDDVRRSEEPTGTEESASRRPARVVFEQQMADLIAEQGPRGPVFDNLSADGERIRQYLATELDPAAQGVVIVACGAHDVFEPLAFALPVPTRISIGPVPVLHDVARVIDDHPTYAVLLADQKDARLTFVRYGQASRTVSLEASGYPRHQQQGGWSQRRYQARADERIEAFARDVAEETRKALDALNVRMLIVGGNEVMLSALDDAFHETVKERIVKMMPLDIRSSESEVIDATLPIAQEAERDREAGLVTTLRDAVGAGGKGAAGGEGTLEALQAGQVQALVMTDTYSEPGWADYSLPLFGVGHPPKEHPGGGDVAAIQPVVLEEEFIRLALQQDADLEIIHSGVPVSDDEQANIPEANSPLPVTDAAAGLQELGGVGAILRFTLDPAPPESI